MRLVLWPNHLLGGLLRREGGAAAAERGEGGNASLLAEGLRGIAGRIQDTDALLQSSMSDELRDWDLWYTLCFSGSIDVLMRSRGPLVFSILLSLLLSLVAAPEQKQDVFTGVFFMVWVGTLVVTWQIRLLGGKLYDSTLEVNCFG